MSVFQELEAGLTDFDLVIAHFLVAQAQPLGELADDPVKLGRHAALEQSLPQCRMVGLAIGRVQVFDGEGLEQVLQGEDDTVNPAGWIVSQQVMTQSLPQGTLVTLQARCFQVVRQGILVGETRGWGRRIGQQLFEEWSIDGGEVAQRIIGIDPFPARRQGQALEAGQTMTFFNLPQDRQGAADPVGETMGRVHGLTQGLTLEGFETLDLVSQWLQKGGERARRMLLSLDGGRLGGNGGRGLGAKAPCWWGERRYGR